MKPHGLAYVSIVVRIFRITTGSHSSVRGDATVDAIDRTEGVDVNLEVGERLVRARLEGGSVAAGLNIEGMNRCEDGVRILAGATTASV